MREVLFCPEAYLHNSMSDQRLVNLAIYTVVNNFSHTNRRIVL